jgi:hypothetical protein
MSCAHLSISVANKIQFNDVKNYNLKRNPDFPLLSVVETWSRLSWVQIKIVRPAADQTGSRSSQFNYASKAVTLEDERPAISQETAFIKMLSRDPTGTYIHLQSLDRARELRQCITAQLLCLNGTSYICKLPVLNSKITWIRFHWLLLEKWPKK